ncbi:MAG: hypothetical protein JNK60_08835 [Acidobacteria bacterium]|nr:hypothetical protein [Acidobacteriota bacterium]
MTHRKVLLLGLLWLAWIWTLAFLARDVLPALPGHPTSWSADFAARAVPLARWDSGWYAGLAEKGYEAPPTEVSQQTNHAFFPLYPMLVRGVSALTGLETTRAGALVSALAFLGALPLFARFVRRRFGEDLVLPALSLLLLFPPSFFFAAVYTESLVLLLSLLALEAAESDRPGLAFVAGFLAGLTRISGLLLVPLIGLAVYRAERRPMKSIGLALGPAAGFAAFMAYFAVRFGDPFLFSKAQHNWAKEAKTVIDGPLLFAREILQDLTVGPLRKIQMVEAGMLFLFLVLAVVLVKRRPPLWPEGIYVALCVAIVILTGTRESGGRYVLVAFPAFAALAGLLEGRRALLAGVLATCAVLQAFYVVRFVNWLWVG